ncbi:MAG: lipoyl(octanoyl) transferase LipB [Pseudanabaenaceae cyanobacterium]
MGATLAMNGLAWLYKGDRPLPYATVWQWQRSAVAARRAQPDLPPVVFAVEHESVYTLGRGSTWDFVKFAPEAPDITWYRTERGGEVTYHGPGQAVVYPILNLTRYQPDLHWYLRQLEEVVIQTLGGWGIPGTRHPGRTGVWVGDRKIAQMGIQVSRWITMHGLALNVDMDLAPFDRIVPCGLAGWGICQVRDFCPTVTVAEAQTALLAGLAQQFRWEWVPLPNPESP